MGIKASDINHLLANYHILFLGLIAILLPFQTFGPESGFNPMPLMIVIWGFVWLSDMFIRWHWPKFRLTFDAFLPIGFVLVTILSLFFTENLAGGWSRIQVRLSLLFMPLFLINKALNRNSLRTILRLFIFSTALASIILLIRSLMRYSELGWHAFFYSEFSFFLHPSYFALYLLTCIIFLVLLDDPLKWAPWVRITLSLFFVLIIYLTSSRAGLLTTILVLSFAFFKSPLIERARQRYFLIFVFLLMGLLAMFLNYRTHTAAKDATNALIAKGSPTAAIESVESESSPLRIMIWGSAQELIRTNWLVGYGVGDVQDELTTKYYQKGFETPARKQLNAHNQFLQSILEAGLLGFLAILFLVLPWRRLACWRGTVFGISVLASYIIHLMFESILNTQSGVIMLAWTLVLAPHIAASINNNSDLSPKPISDTQM